MFIIIGFMLTGVLTGWLLRRFALSFLSKIIMVLIWVLLFLLGIEVGGNESIIRNLSTLGIEALLLTMGAVLGSILAACVLWHFCIKTQKIKI